MNAARRGILCLAVALAIWTLWPVYTRHGVTTAFEPEDIVLLRFGVSGVVFLPILLAQAKSLPNRAWLWGLLFALCQGPLFVFAVSLGLRYAPAGYVLAMSPGVMPLFAAALGMMLFRERLCRRRMFGLVCIALGAVTMALLGAGIGTPAAAGCLLFLLTAFMGAVYVVLIPRSGLTALQATALLCVTSMLVYAPVYVAGDLGRLHQAPIPAIVMQGVLQGLLMAGVSLVAYSSAVMVFGAPRAGAVMALTPVTAMAAAVPILGEVPTVFEIGGALIIGLGVCLASRRSAARVGTPKISPVAAAQLGFRAA